MEKVNSALLEFDQNLNQIGDGKKLSSGLSVSVMVENTLWVANDESISLERLSFKGKDTAGNYLFGDHQQFLLSDFIPLPVPPTMGNDGELKFKEADIEGLDYHDGWLWVVGSHSAKRKKLESGSSATAEQMLNSLSAVKSDGNRFIFARIPVVKEGGTYLPKKNVVENGNVVRTAAMLGNGIVTNEKTNLPNDKHLGMFLNIPGKDNGFDIEGLAVSGSKVFIGLRGPVLRGWAVILELELKLEAGHQISPIFNLKGYKKHVLQLDGLGIRDVYIQGSDLLILAGPTMDLDGPVYIYRWIGGVNAENERVVFKGDTLNNLTEVPFGKGDDHAEGMTLFSSTGSNEPDSIMIVYDSASDERQSDGTSSLKADVFALP